MYRKLKKLNNWDNSFAILLSCAFIGTVYSIGQFLRNLLISFFSPTRSSVSTEDYAASSDLCAQIGEGRRNDASISAEGTPSVETENSENSESYGPRKRCSSPASKFENLCRNRDILDYTGVSDCQAQLACFIHLVCQDGLAGFEVCACSLETSIIREICGLHVYLLAVGLQNIRMTRCVWKDAFGNPCNSLLRSAAGLMPVGWMLLSWAMQLLGAFAALQFCLLWWSLGLSQSHTHRLSQYLAISRLANKTPNDLQVSLFGGCVIEGGSAFVDILLADILPVILARHKLAQWRWASQVTVIYAFRMALNLAILGAALPLTGCFVNPVNAFIHSFRVGRVFTFAHFLVYWFAPLSGTLLGFLLSRRLSALFLGSPRITESSTQTRHTNQQDTSFPLVNSIDCLQTALLLAPHQALPLGEMSSFSEDTNKLENSHNKSIHRLATA